MDLQYFAMGLGCYRTGSGSCQFLICSKRTMIYKEEQDESKIFVDWRGCSVCC